MNWGKWIVVSFILFAAFIGALVTVCMRQDVSLVSKDYYKQELAYQDQIERISNSNNLDSKPSFSIASDSLQLQLNSAVQLDRGEVELFCPSNEKMDRHFVVEPGIASTQKYALTGLQKGMYRIKLTWHMNGKEFYQEQIINL